jgi:flagellar basal-body rod modification protein FlgD
MTTTSSVNPFTSLTTAASTSSTANSVATAATNASNTYNTFLTLLTTQLQNQDPMNPTDTDTFTSEMIQLSGVEQELQANQTLSSISTDLTSITAANGLGYIGKTVTASGSTTPLQSGSAGWTYTLNQTAANVALTVQNASGNTVYSTSGDASSGQHSFTWNGQDSNGNTVPSGDYTLTVTATDSSGAPVTTTTDLVGTVTGVDTSNGQTQLLIGDITVPISNVTTLSN